MNILIVYGTGEGHTRKIVDFCAEYLRNAGHEADIRNCDRMMVDLNISKYDAVILAGSVHEQRHQAALENFAFAHREQLKALPSLFVSVSLSIAFENGELEAGKYVGNFIENSRFEPNYISLVAGALRFAQYSYYMNSIVEHVVLENREMIRGGQGVHGLGASCQTD